MKELLDKIQIKYEEMIAERDSIARILNEVKVQLQDKTTQYNDLEVKHIELQKRWDDMSKLVKPKL